MNNKEIKFLRKKNIHQHYQTGHKVLTSIQYFLRVGKGEIFYPKVFKYIIETFIFTQYTWYTNDLYNNFDLEVTYVKYIYILFSEICYIYIYIYFILYS